MGRKSVAVLPQTQAILEQLGEQIKLARLRRHLSAELVAERAGVSRATVWNVEKGNPSVAIGIYAAVLHALNNMDKDLLLVAKDDELGRKLQDLELTTRKRAPRNGGDLPWHKTKKQFMSMRASDLQSQTSWGRSSWRMSVAGRATHLSMMLTG